MAWNQLSNKTREMRDLTGFKHVISQDITFYHVFFILYNDFFPAVILYFKLLPSIFTTIISLDYHIN